MPFRIGGRVVGKLGRPTHIERPDLIGPVKLLTYHGLGDLLLAATVCYAAAEAGRQVSLGYVQREYEHPVTGADPAEVPLLPLFADVPGMVPLNITRSDAFRWTVPGVSMLDRLCVQTGSPWHATPRTACLGTVTEAHEARLLVTTHAEPYCIIAPEAHSSADAKRLSAEQVRAAAVAALNVGLRPVLVGLSGNGAPPHPAMADLRGLTDTAELCALVAGATLVVSAECGVAHLAAAYQTPCLWVSPRATTPHAVLADYAPVLLLEAAEACQVPAEAVARGVARLAAAARMGWRSVAPEARTCGVAATAGRVAATGSRDDGGVPVVEYHPAGKAPAAEPRSSVLSAHLAGGVRLREWGAVLFRVSERFRLLRQECRRAYYVPLPCLEVPERPLPEKPRVLGWHGIVHGGKGLGRLIEEWRRLRAAGADVELRLTGSIGDATGEGPTVRWLRAQKDPGLSVEIRPHWEDAELVERLTECDVLCYMDGAEGPEQSAASADALGFGRPVVVGESTKHADTRGWCVPAGSDLAKTLQGLLTNPDAYRAAVQRARMGASFRRPAIIARQYRAAACQAAIDEG